MKPPLLPILNHHVNHIQWLSCPYLQISLCVSLRHPIHTVGHRLHIPSNQHPVELFFCCPSATTTATYPPDKGPSTSAESEAQSPLVLHPVPNANETNVPLIRDGICPWGASSSCHSLGGPSPQRHFHKSHWAQLFPRFIDLENHQPMKDSE